MHTKNTAPPADQAAPLESRRRIRFPGITYDARELGVTYNHLWRVLTGDRESPGLVQRYHALQARKKKAE